MADDFLNAVRARLQGGPSGPGAFAPPRLDAIPDATSFHPLSDAGFAARLSGASPGPRSLLPIDNVNGVLGPTAGPPDGGGSAVTGSLQLTPQNVGQEGYYVPRTSEGVMQDLQLYAPLMKAGGGIRRVDRTRTNLGYELAQSASEEAGKAVTDEAYWNQAEQQDLGGVAGKREKIYEEGAKAAAERRKAVDEKVAGAQKKIDADIDYVRNNPVDPYRSFRTNAGAGALALLGSALMATGAAMRRDNSLDWVKQIDKLLEREAQTQIRMLEDKKWAATEEGQNVKRIVDTSRDVEEAATRIQAQKLGVLAERAAAISANAKGEQLKARGKKAVADLREKLGEHAINIGIREQALESQENQADLQSRTQTNLGNLGFAGTVVQSAAAEAAKKRQLDYEQSLPVRTRLQEIEKKYQNAHSSIMNFWQVLRDPAASDADKNAAAVAQASAWQDFMGGSNAPAGVRAGVATFGYPTSFKEFMNKLNKQPTIYDMQSAIRRLDQAAYDMAEHTRSGKWVTPAPPWGSSYSVRK